MKKDQRPKNQQKDEHPADLLFWLGDGELDTCRARVATDTKVSIGRTNSKRALGFIIVSNGRTPVEFVLDRDQVADLAAFLQHCAYPRLLKPRGRKNKYQTSFAALNSPKYRLHKILECAAIDAHPGWHAVDGSDDEFEVDDGAPEGEALVAWFKKIHARDATRIEKAFIEELLSQ